MRRLLGTLLLVLLARAVPADAPRAEIERLTATESAGKVSVSLRLAGAFRNGEMVEALRSGLPTTFVYSIEIFRDRPRWFDAGVGTARIEAICTYNSLTREYLLNYRRDRHLVRSETFTDIAALEEAMTRVEEADLFDVSGWKVHKLKVRARASLMRGWFLWVFPSDVGTPWREVRVRGSGADR